jgi:hypothetical protein
MVPSTVSRFERVGVPTPALAINAANPPNQSPQLRPRLGQHDVARLSRVHDPLACAFVRIRDRVNLQHLLDPAPFLEPIGQVRRFSTPSEVAPSGLMSYKAQMFG